MYKKPMRMKSVHNLGRIGYPIVSISTEDRETILENSLLDKTIQATLVTPYILGEKPISLMIVAKPESGKTSAMKRYSSNKGIIYLTDATAYGIQRDILPKLTSGEIRTIMIADLITPLSKSTKTRQAFVAFCNNMIEEGVAKITTYAMTWDKEVKGNIVTAVTDQALDDGRHEWAKIGFLSRFIMFSYSYDLSTVHAILQSYSRGGLINRSKTMEFPKENVDVTLDPQIADKLDPLAVRIGDDFGIYGIRAKINLRSLLKALAYLNGRVAVQMADFDELLRLVDYMNFKYNPLR